jgi:50S ribosomal protein L16 3-hydroxylase
MRNADAASRTLLGKNAPATFLRRFWQKEACLVRGALPDFAGPFSREALFTLAGRDDVESRLVIHGRGRWSLEQGPFRRAHFRALPAAGWTLLVQGANLHSAPADALLRRFSFVPYARLDDLMVSLAAPGGGVGPHCDSYDVFLLQGYGHRRWRYGRQDDLSMKPRLPVKVLRHFTPSHDAVLAPGDLLYLPPSFAHDGVAVDECTTYSIGFRAASYQELVEAFLDHLRDQLSVDGRYADPDLRSTREPARIEHSMRAKVARLLHEIRWDAATTDRFLGIFLSEPKPDIVFDPPARPLGRVPFIAAAQKKGVILDRRTQWLYDDENIYVNGEAFAWPEGGRLSLTALANARGLGTNAARTLSAAAFHFLHDLYRHGFLHIA